MEKYSRSKSTREGVMQQQHPSSMHDLRSYSTTSAYSYNQTADHNNDDSSSSSNNNNNFKMIKKNRVSASSKNWNFQMDPELQRKKRVAGYKAYTVEGKMKGSFRKSFRWIKDTCNHVVHGIW